MAAPRQAPGGKLLRGEQPHDFAEWLAAWKAWPGREIHAHPAYVRIDARRVGAAPRCYLWRFGKATVLYPFLLRDLSRETYWTDKVGPAYDIATPYGYGGPYCWGGEGAASVGQRFWADFDRWAESAGVVSEFVRFSLLKNVLGEYPGARVAVQQSVIRRLDLDEEQLWADFEHKVRKNVKRARREGLTVEFDPAGRRLEDFLRIYHNSMSRRGARSEYYFSREYFADLNRDLGDGAVFAHVLGGRRVVSTELVLVSAETVYSFLGGTDSSAFDKRPNDLLKFEVMRWARQAGKKQYVLGGGHAAEDGIFRYKRSFAPRGGTPFYVGRRVLRPAVYEQLTLARRALRSPPPTDDRYFPAYRAA